MYPAMWSVVSDMCDQQPIRVTKTIPYRVTAFLYNCVRLPHQSFIVRNGDLDVYHTCVLDMEDTTVRNNLRCDFEKRKTDMT